MFPGVQWISKFCSRSSGVGQLDSDFPELEASGHMEALLHDIHVSHSMSAPCCHSPATMALGKLTTDELALREAGPGNRECPGGTQGTPGQVAGTGASGSKLPAGNRHSKTCPSRLAEDLRVSQWGRL